MSSLTCLCLHLPQTDVGNLEKGDLGLAALPARIEEFRASLDKAVEYALALQCNK